MMDIYSTLLAHVSFVAFYYYLFQLSSVFCAEFLGEDQLSGNQQWFGRLTIVSGYHSPHLIQPTTQYLTLLFIYHKNAF